jgi:hypothetical protein
MSGSLNSDFPARLVVTLATRGYLVSLTGVGPVSFCSQAKIAREGIFEATSMINVSDGQAATGIPQIK